MAEFKVGSFTAPSSTGTQSVTGVGFTPKAILFWASGSNGSSGIWGGDVDQTIGFTSGPSESYAVAGFSDDGQSTSQTARAIAAKAVAFVNGLGSATSAEADLDSFDADGFTLDWTKAGVSAQKIMFLAIGGDDVDAKVVNWTSPTSTGNKAVTGVGFTPDVVLHMPTASTVIPASSAGMIGTGFGAMDGSGNQWMNTLAAQDAQSTSNTSRYQRTDKCVAYINDTGTVNEEAAFVSMDADGFTTNFTSANGVAVNYISLCLSGLDAKVGSFAKTTSGAPASQSVTGVGFEPGAVLLSSWGWDEFNHGSVVNDAIWALGGGDGTNERTVLQVDDDGVATTVVESIWKNSKVLSIDRTPVGGPTIDSEADLDSFDPDGFTLNWTTNDANAVGILYLALGSLNTPVAGGQVSEAGTVNPGQIDAVVAGTQIGQVGTVAPGTTVQGVPGTQVTEAGAVTPGTIDATVTGSQVVETGTVAAGAPAAALPGTQITETGTVHTGVGRINRYIEIFRVAARRRWTSTRRRRR